jgi:hypothetical protein
MKKTLLSIVAASSLALGSTGFAGGPSTYQVTGPVLEVSDTVIAVQKGKDRWEIARSADTKVTGDLKVGAKVTITYTMTATTVEVKPDKPAKADKAAKPSASPAASAAAK